MEIEAKKVELEREWITIYREKIAIEVKRAATEAGQVGPAGITGESGVMFALMDDEQKKWFQSVCANINQRHESGGGSDGL